VVLNAFAWVSGQEEEGDPKGAPVSAAAAACARLVLIWPTAGDAESAAQNPTPQFNERKWCFNGAAE